MSEAVQPEQSTVKPEQVKKTLGKEKKIKRKANRTIFGKVADDVHNMFDLLRDWWMGRYPDAPLWTIAGINFALLYILNPLDMAPDYIPLLGLMDDVAVVSATSAMIRQDVRDYLKWKTAFLKSNTRKDASEQ